MRKILIPVIFVLIISGFLVGCTESNPVSTGFSSANGYSINLGTSSKSVPFGGSLVFNAIVKDQNGNTVMNSTYPVTFTTTQGGQVTPIQAPISNGVAQVVYVAPQYVLPTNIRGKLAASDVPEVPKIDSLPAPTSVSSDLPRSEVVTATFQGASARISVNVFKP